MNVELQMIKTELQMYLHQTISPYVYINLSVLSLQSVDFIFYYYFPSQRDRYLNFHPQNLLQFSHTRLNPVIQENTFLSLS